MAGSTTLHPSEQSSIPIRIWRAAPALLATLGYGLVIVLTYEVFTKTLIVAGDLATYLLPTRYVQQEFGTLYVDVFDLKPPVVYSVVRLWASIFGWSLVSLWALYAIMLATLGLLFWKLLRSMTGAWPALALFSSASLVLVGFNMFEEILFTTEVLALLFVLSALLVAWRLRLRAIAIVISTLLATLAGQTKEVFILAPIAILPFVWSHRGGWPTRLAQWIAGVIAGLAMVGIALLWWGSTTLTAYFDILTFKRERFPSPGLNDVGNGLGDVVGAFQSWLPLLWLLPIAVLASLLVVGWSNHRAHVKTQWIPNPKVLSALLLFAVTVFGLIWQGAPIVLHYAIAGIFPLYLLGAAVLNYVLVMLNPGSRMTRRVFVLLVLASFLPSVSAVQWSLGRTGSVDPGAILSNATQAENDEVLAIFQAIKERSASTECIHVAYGWTAASYYLYADRPACSRFMIPPLALDPQTRAEFQRDLQTNPPRLIVLDPSLRGETALPASEGTPETVIFPFESVVRECYAPVDSWPTLFGRISDAAEASQCIEEQLARGTVRGDRESGGFAGVSP